MNKAYEEVQARFNRVAADWDINPTRVALAAAGFAEVKVCDAHTIMHPDAKGGSRQYHVFLVTGRAK